MKKYKKNVKRSILFALLTIATVLLMSDENKNYQINGSFEYASNPDIPDYWAGTGNIYRTNGLPMEICVKDKMAEYRKKFFLDETESKYGKKSMRIEMPFHLLGMQMSVPPNSDYTISVYLKSSRKNMHAIIGATERDIRKPIASKEVVVDKEWKRYEIQMPKYARKKISFFLTPLDSGKLWADAVQIESGQKATAFEKSQYDKGFTEPRRPAQPPIGATASTPSVNIANPAKTAPKFDGNLDDALWKNATELKLNDYMGAKATTATSVKIAYDKQNIYLGFKCGDPENSKGIDDSVEIFLDPLGIGEPFYQFIFNAKGEKHNFKHTVTGLHDWNWQADWTVKTQLHDGYWTAEAGIPFAAIPDFKYLDSINAIYMNFCRFYGAGREKYLCWSPINVGFLEPDRFGKVILGNAENITIAAPKLLSEVPTKNIYTLNIPLKNNTEKDCNLTVTVLLECCDQAPQLKSKKIKLPKSSNKTLSINGLYAPDKLCRADVVLHNEKGQKMKHLRNFINVPQPLEIYAEYSYYTSEPEARIIADFDCDKELLRNSKLDLTLALEGYPQAILSKAQCDLNENSERQLIKIPIKNLKPGHAYIVTAKLFNPEKRLLLKASAKLNKYAANDPEVKINRINRGVYLNGKPYIPYGMHISIADINQLRYLKKCGFDFVNFTSHWHSSEKNIEFLADCKKVGINAIAFHVSRPYSLTPSDALEKYRNCPALIGVVPNDENGDLSVYDLATSAKNKYPEILNCVNHNISSYQAFANRLRGFPGDILSIDRYPLLLLPKGRPQTTSEIYSVERCIELMDKDAQRNHKPLFFWLQAAERFSKEPTPEELTWLTYILLVNHCVGFTYFGGIPQSKFVWQRIQSLNKEVQSLKPALFSLEKDPEIKHLNPESKGYIRVLAKKQGKQLTLICVNRAMSPVMAELDLSDAGKFASKRASVMFEKRSVKITRGDILKDSFAPLARHVYKINLPK